MLCKDNGLKRQAERLQVAKWNREQARAAVVAARREAEMLSALSKYQGQIDVVEKFSEKEYVVSMETPVIADASKHFLENLSKKADRAGLTIESAQDIINNNKLVIYQADRKTLKFLSDKGYAVLNLQKTLVTAVPEKLRKRYRDYLEGNKNGENA